MTLLMLCSLLSAHPVIDCMPEIEDKDLQKIVSDEWTLFYNSNTHPRMTQMDGRVYSQRYHFNPQGNSTNPNMHYPWRIGGGLHEVDLNEVVVEKFYWHPEHKPIRYYREVRRNGFANRVRENTIDFKCPLDCVFGEILTLKHQGTTYVIEVRTLVCEEDAWQPFTYRRWNTHEDLSKSIASLGFNDVAAQIAELPVNQRTVIDRTHGQYSVLQVDFNEVDLPRLPNDVTAKLLETSPLVAVFEPSNLYANTTQILPAKYHPAQAGVSQDDCMKCHKHVAVHAQLLQPGIDWYAYVSGSAKAKNSMGIFSLPGLDPSALEGGLVRPDPRLIRAGYLAPFNNDNGYQK